LFDTLLAELGHPDDPDLVLACVLTYRTHRPRLAPFPGVLDAFEAVRAAGVSIGLVSDGHGAVQRRKLAALPSVTRRLDTVVLTDELGNAFAKPSPTGFRVACRLLGAEVSRAVYVANDPRKDFVGARQAGLGTIRTGRLPDEGGAMMGRIDADSDADVVVSEFSELADALLDGGSSRYDPGR
jgi:putative hydrolase of the HAD superfamily